MEEFAIYACVRDVHTCKKIQKLVVGEQNWIPAFAGMTVFGLRADGNVICPHLSHVVPAQAGT